MHIFISIQVYKMKWICFRLPRREKCRGYVSENRQIERHSFCPLEPCGMLLTTMSKRCDIMNCRGEDTREQIVKDYFVKPVDHLRLLNGKSKRSDAEVELSDQYYIFKCVSKTNSKIVDTIICGKYAAEHFLRLTGEDDLPLFDPLKSDLPHNLGKPRRSNPNPDKWNKEAKQLYNATQWLIICWDITPHGAITDIKDKLLKFHSRQPLLSQIKAVNTIISKDREHRTLTQMINEFRAMNDLKEYDFSLLGNRLREADIQSHF